jgi:hypothetical protein
MMHVAYRDIVTDFRAAHVVMGASSANAQYQPHDHEPGASDGNPLHGCNARLEKAFH